MRQAVGVGFVVAFVLAFTASGAEAAAPSNDDFAAAAPLAVGGEVMGSNVEATAQPEDPELTAASFSSSCTAFAEGPQCGTSVWYTFQPTSGGEYTIETCDLSTEPDTLLGIYTGAFGSLTAVSTDDDGPCPNGNIHEWSSRITFVATAGTVYHVEVAGFVGAMGTFYLRAYPGPPRGRPSPDTGIYNEDSLSEGSVSEFGIASGPRRTPSFSLLSTPEGTPLECSLDGGPFAACTSPVSYEGLPAGSSHVFVARASAGGALDPTPVTQRFTLDETPPDTVITSGPSGPLASQSATWTWAGTERSNGNGKCTLDGAPTSCGHKFAVVELCQGHHTFTVAAADRAGNVDPTPATAQVDVTTGPACAPPTVEHVLDTPSPTSARVRSKFDDKGAGAVISVDYGTTTAYGMRIPSFSVLANLPNEFELFLRFLAPGTLYHYRITIANAFGTATTGDLTVTSSPLVGTVPAVQNGTPAAQPFAVRLPTTVDPVGVGTQLSAYVTKGEPVTGAATLIASHVTIEGGAGPQVGNVEVVDLEPGTTYNYRIAAVHQGMTDRNEVLGPEGSFTTPNLAVPVAKKKTHFRLRKGLIKIGKLTRRSGFLKARVHGLPAGTVVIVKLIAGKRHVKARKKVKSNGSVAFKVKLQKKVRKALHEKTLKFAKVRVTASPPGDSSSSVTLKKKLKP